MTRKIVLLFLFLNISLVLAQKPCVKNDIQEFQETMQDDGNFFENKKQTILRFYLAARRSINPLVVDYALARYGIKNPKTKIVAHAVVNSVTHVAAYKALDPEIELKKLVKGAVIFSGAEALKTECNGRLVRFMPRTITSDGFYYNAYERFFVIARLLWNNKKAIQQKSTQLKEADSNLASRPGINKPYTTEMTQLHTTGSANMNIIIDSLEKKLRKNPEDQSLVNALSAAKSLMQFQQGTLQNLKDIAIIFAKEKIEKQFDDQIDWAIEFIQA